MWYLLEPKRFILFGSSHFQEEEDMANEKNHDLMEDKDAPFSRTTRYRLRNREENPLKFFKIGRRIYYSRAHWEELLRNSEKRPAKVSSEERTNR